MTATQTQTETNLTEAARRAERRRFFTRAKQPKRRLFDRNKLTDARLEIGMSMAEAARRIGVVRQQLYQYETGRARPTIENLATLMRLYNKPFEFFLTVENDLDGGNQ